MYRIRHFFLKIKVNGSKQNIDIHQYTRERLLKWLEFMRTRKGDTLVRLLKKQQTHYPSIQGVWTPFTNKKTFLAVEKFPSEKFKDPLDKQKSALDKILELEKNLNKNQS
jgi:large subunit ribosomal protein L43